MDPRETLRSRPAYLLYQIWPITSITITVICQIFLFMSAYNRLNMQLQAISIKRTLYRMDLNSEGWTESKRLQVGQHRYYEKSLNYMDYKNDNHIALLRTNRFTIVTERVILLHC